MIFNEPSLPATLRLNWDSLHGTILEGGYELGKICQADDERASFQVRVLGDAHCKALAQFHSATPSVSHDQLTLWMCAKRLNHPNLTSPLDSGVYQLDGNELIYVVTPVPDERLDSIITERALEAAEAKELLQVLKAGLSRLHAEGLVHGCVSPEHVFAFGETIQLSTLPVRPINSAIPLQQEPARYVAPESAAINATPAADVWCLGATLFEALTQRRYSPDLYGEANNLPDLVRGFITHSLDTSPPNRPRLDARLAPPNRAAAPASASAVPPRQPEHIAPPLTRKATPATHKIANFRIWIYAGAGLLVILLLIWAARPKHTPKPPAESAPTIASSSSSTPAWRTRTLGDTNSSDSARRSPTTPAATAAVPNGPANWRVVLYTFARQEDAEKRARALNERYANLAAQVFAPHSRTTMYLVTAGGRMTREDAVKARSHALQMGMPRDTYIQNYKE